MKHSQREEPDGRFEFLVGPVGSVRFALSYSSPHPSRKEGIERGFATLAGRIGEVARERAVARGAGGRAVAGIRDGL